MLRLLRSTCIPRTALVRSYAEDEEGAITVMGLILFGLMVLAFGVAIDIMRSENDRIAMQATIDRAVLAAAPLSEEREAREVVESYLRAADIDPSSVRIQTFDEPYASRVTVDAESRVDSLFMDVFGQETINASVSGQAREEKWDLEVAMVLDTSGSMGGQKLVNMKSAAIEFTQELFNAAQEEDLLTSMTIVPYNGYVNAGSEVGSWFPMTMEHTHSRCVAFYDMEHYETTDITESFPLPRMMHFDRDETRRNYHGINRRSYCPTDDTGAILPWTTDIQTVTDHVNSFSAGGWTAIGQGVKWAVALLDPSTQPQMDAWVARGEIDEAYTVFPAEYEATGFRKVLVVMTDGDNTVQPDVRDDRKNGPSGVFVHRVDLELPVRDVIPLSDRNGDGTVDNLDTPCMNGNGDGDGVTCDVDDTGAFRMPSHGIDNIDGRSNWSASWHGTRARSQDWLANGRKYNGYPWWEDADRRNWTEFDERGTHPDTGADTYTQYSIWSEERQKFWIKNVRTGSDWHESSGGYYADAPAGGTAAIELTFAELYSAIPIRHSRFTNSWGSDPNRVALDAATRNWYFGERQEQSSTAWQRGINQTTYARLDDRLEKICTEAREKGVLVYTIAFQAPDGGRRAMEKCAGEENPGRYFNITGLDISTAFDGILANIDKLKLTQ